MKKWAVIGILAAVLAVCVLLIGKYQDQKYPIQPDHSNLQEEVTWWVNRGYDQPVLDVVIHDYVDLGDRQYVLIDVDGQFGRAWLEKGRNGQYRVAGHGHGTGNFQYEKVEMDGVHYFLWSGKNQYFGIRELSFEIENETYRAEIPEGDHFIVLVEVDPPWAPDTSPRYIDVNTVHFYDADGQDITDQVPWNGMRPWDGTPSVSQS